MGFYGRGMSVRDIAINMDLSIKTISTYLSRAQEKLGIANRGELRIHASTAFKAALVGGGASS